VDWEALRADAWWLPPSALSLHGVPDFMAVSTPKRQRLSQLEFMHYVNVALWLEGLFMQRLARSLPQLREDLARTAYHLHELREEAGHSLMFVELLRRAGLSRPPLQTNGMRLLSLVGRHAPLNSLLFWLAVLVGEEIPDRFNRFVRQHQDQICTATHDIVRVHMIDEARHIAYAHDMVRRRMRTTPAWRRAPLQYLAQTLLRRFVRLFYFPNADLYELAGLTPGTDWTKAARTNRHRLDFVQAQLSPLVHMLEDLGLRLDAPTGR
jgi:hypothetical protein